MKVLKILMMMASLKLSFKVLQQSFVKAEVLIQALKETKLQRTPLIYSLQNQEPILILINFKLLKNSLTTFKRL